MDLLVNLPNNKKYRSYLGKYSFSLHNTLPKRVSEHSRGKHERKKNDAVSSHLTYARVFVASKLSYVSLE